MGIAIESWEVVKFKSCIGSRFYQWWKVPLKWNNAHQMDFDSIWWMWKFHSATMMLYWLRENSHLSTCSDLWNGMHTSLLVRHKGSFLPDSIISYQTWMFARGKEKIEQLPCEQFLQAFEIYRALLRAKKVREKRGKIQNPVKLLTRQLLFFSFHSSIW